MVKNNKNENERSERLATMGENISMVAHTLRNVSSKVVLATNIIYDIKVGHKLNQQDKMAIEIVYDESKNLIRICNNILLFANSLIHPVLKSHNIRSFLMQKIYEFEELCKVNFDLVLNDEDEGLTITFDEHLLSIVITDIVRNALEAENVKNIWVTGVKGDKGKSFVISIINDGKMIPEDTLKNIFQPFFTTKVSRGTGLGLAMAEKIIEAHKGHIKAFSSDSKTTFEITLPL